jgi:hypothetical protein
VGLAIWCEHQKVTDELRASQSHIADRACSSCSDDSASSAIDR